MLHTKVGGSKEKPFAVLTGEVGDKISVSSILPNLTQGGEEFQLDAGALSSWLHDGSGVAPSQINDCMVVVSEAWGNGGWGRVVKVEVMIQAENVLHPSVMLQASQLFQVSQSNHENLPFLLLHRRWTT